MDRPLERRTSARTAVVWDAVQRLLAQPQPSSEDRPEGHSDGQPRGAEDQHAEVLDIGGGTGGLAVRVAGHGHRVTVVDPSPDALAALARRADEEGVASRVTGVQGDLGNLADLVPDGGVDLVLCHGVLGLVEDPDTALRTIAAALRPGGALSLLVSQRHAAVLARAMAGHFTQAKALLDDSEQHREQHPGQHPEQRGGERRFTAEEVRGLLAGAGFATTGIHGIRVFSDLVPSSLLEVEPGATNALLDLERAVAERPEYLTVAAQLHALATH